MDTLKILSLRDLAIAHYPKAQKMRADAMKYQGGVWADYGLTLALTLENYDATAVEKAAHELLQLTVMHPDARAIDPFPWDAVKDAETIATKAHTLEMAVEMQSQIETLMLDAARLLCELTGVALPPWVDAADAPAPKDKVRLSVTDQHDENFQMVSPFEIDSIWHLTESWDIDQACRLILLGYNEDIKRAIDYGFEHCPEGSTGRDRASALITITDRFMTLAKSATALHGGTLKNPDTPANWCKWAARMGYSVAHLMPADVLKGDDKVTANWILLVQIEAAFLWRETRKLNCSPTKNNIKNDLAKRCREKGIKTDYLIYPSAGYIYKHVLRRWTPPTD